MSGKDRELVADIKPFGLRMQPDLKARIAEAARENNRSMNSEIVARLEGGIDRDAEGAFKIWLPEELLNRILSQAERRGGDPNLLIVEALKKAFPNLDNLVEILVFARQRMKEETSRQPDPEIREYGEHRLRQIDEMIEVARQAEKAKQPKY